MSDGLIGEEFTNRPDDDELAFLHYEKLFRGPRDEALFKLQEESHDGYWNASNHFTRTYINHVIAMVKALNLDILEYWVNDPSAASDEKNFKQVEYDIDAAIIGIKVRHAQLGRKSSIRLEKGTREKFATSSTRSSLLLKVSSCPCRVRKR